MIEGACGRTGCRYRCTGGACDYILITGRPRGCSVENCNKYTKGPKGTSQSDWVGGTRKPAGKIEIEVEAKGIEETTEQIESLNDAVASFPPQVTVRNCDGCTINIYATQYAMTGGEDDE